MLGSTHFIPETPSEAILSFNNGFEIFLLVLQENENFGLGRDTDRQRQRDRLLPHRASKQYKEQALYEYQQLQWELKDNDVNS